MQSLYEEALSKIEGKNDDLVLCQLLYFIHFHFLFSHACLMRCHLSEAFGSARAAIDAALIAAQVIHDRPSGRDYLTGEGPFKNYARYLGNLIANGKPLPHPLVRDLIGIQKTLSKFSVQLHIWGFYIRRAAVTGDAGSEALELQYFQLAESTQRRAFDGLQSFS